MNLTVREAYLTMFNVLDSYYDETKNDALGMLLSSASPYLFQDSMSADPAVWDDWENCVKKVTDGELLSVDEVFRATLLFLGFYVEEFDFDLGWIIKKINVSSENDSRWIEYANEVLKQERA